MFEQKLKGGQRVREVFRGTKRRFQGCPDWQGANGCPGEAGGGTTRSRTVPGPGVVIFVV